MMGSGARVSPSAFKQDKEKRGLAWVEIEHSAFHTSILGRPLRFTKRGDVKGARFAILQNVSGDKVTVAR